MDLISATIPYLENSSEFLYSLTDSNFCLLNANRLFQKQFEVENENWKGRPFTEVVQTPQIEKFIEACDEFINNPGKSICLEMQTTKTLQETWIRWEGSAIINKKKQVEGIHFLGTDITKQKKAELLLLQHNILPENISDV